MRSLMDCFRWQT